MGILDRALALGNPIHAANFHSKKKRVARISFDDLDSAYPYGLGLSQETTESLLREFLNNYDIQVERSAELISFTQEKTGVKVKYRMADGSEKSLRADYLLGCDGGHSSVRKQLEGKFSGSDLKEHFIMADLPIETSYPQDEIQLFLSSKGIIGIIPFSKTMWRIIAEVSHDRKLAQEKHPTLADFERLVSERCGKAPLKLGTPEWISNFWIHNRIVDRYRHDRIFLLGDAAHLHSPVGGQGMNTGIQDAYNLAWKLALVIKGKARAEILDSYEKERRPLAAKIVKNTSMMTRVVGVNNFILQQLRNKILVWLVHKPRFKNKIAASISELDISYRKSPIVEEYLDWASTGAKTLHAGDRAPNVFLVSDRLYGLIHSTKHILLLFGGKSTSDEHAQNMIKLIHSVNEEYKDLIDSYIVWEQQLILEVSSSTLIEDKTHALHVAYGANHACLYLIRPDKYIGFRSQIFHLDKLLEYLNKFFLK